MKEGWQEMVEGEEEVKTVVNKHTDRSTFKSAYSDDLPKRCFRPYHCHHSIMSQH